MSVDVPDPPLMLVGLSEAARPGDAVAVRLTVPVNPLTDDTVMVAVPVSHAFTTILVVLVLMVKLGGTKSTRITSVLWNVNLKKTKKCVELLVIVSGVTKVPFNVTCNAVMSGTRVRGIVTLAKAVVPAWPVAVKVSIVELAEALVIVALLKTVVVHPLPQGTGVEATMLNPTNAE